MTLRANREAFLKYYLRPRRLNDVSKMDTSMEIFDNTYALETRDYLEKIVAACMDAEFIAYQALPAIDEMPLRLWFRPEGGASYVLTRSAASDMREITRYSLKQWPPR